MIDGKKLRRSTLFARDNLSLEELESKSEAIFSQLLQLDEVVKSKCVFTYVSFRSEVQTVKLIQTFLQEGKVVSVPITLLEVPRIDAIQITDMENDLVPGYCNIPEPKAEILESNLVSPEKIDTIFLPGSVFDERCGRFGYGGGFYDRFVSSVPNAVRIGLAFDLQIVEKAPLKEHDELLDIVVTESRVIRNKRH